MAESVITADDIIRAGACSSGVRKVVKRLATRIAAAMPVSEVLHLVSPAERAYVIGAAQLDGYGYGNGNGDGNGDGDGFGDGYSDGYSYGYGNGNGYGDGSGYGFGYGYGDEGYSYGYGDGSSFGYG